MSDECDLTVTSIINSLKPVNRWFDLGIQLEIKDYDLEKIQHDKGDTDSCKTQMVIHWLRNDTTASWKKLCDALKHMGETRVAQQIEKERRKKVPQILQKLEQGNANDRIITDDEAYEKQQRNFTERFQQGRRRETTHEQDEEHIQKALLKYDIEWTYVVFRTFKDNHEELEHLKERMEAMVAGGNIFKERAKNLKKKKEELCRRAQVFEEIEVYLHEDERELESQSGGLQRLGGTQRLSTGECKTKLSQCRDRLKRCMEQSKICREALRRSNFQLSDCRDKLTLCISEMRLLQKDYERCSRAVEANIPKMNEVVSNVRNTLLEKIISGAAVGGTVGAIVGTAAPVIGTAVGGAIGAVAGGAVGFVRGTVVGLFSETDERAVRLQLSRCQKELQACENTRKECLVAAEKVQKEIGELEDLTGTLFD